MKFRLLAGGHSEQRWVEASEADVLNDAPGLVKRPNGKWYMLIVRKHKAGAVFESDKDLVKVFGRNKFLRMPDDTPLTDGVLPLPERLSKLTIGELRDLAVEHDVDLSKSPGKPAMVETLAKALS